MLSQEFIKELEQLQDNVPPFDPRLAIQIVEESYGKKLSDTFETFNKTPIAAASLGQVQSHVCAFCKVVLGAYGTN